MASIHVIYDAHDRVLLEQLKHLGAGYATLRIDQDLTPASIGQISGELAAMLLKEVAGT
jgi:hypothetical protein